MTEHTPAEYRLAFFTLQKRIKGRNTRLTRNEIDAVRFYLKRDIYTNRRPNIPREVRESFRQQVLDMRALNDILEYCNMKGIVLVNQI